MSSAHLPAFTAPGELSAGADRLGSEQHTPLLTPAVTLAGLVIVSFVVWATILLLLLT